MSTDLLTDIAPAEALGISVSSFENGRIELSAPLEPSKNDKGTAFAGSITSMLVLAGWGAIMAALREAGISADVMVVKSETEYTEAVRGKMISEATLTREELDRILQELDTGKRSRGTLVARLHSNERECAAMTAHYAIILR